MLSRRVAFCPSFIKGDFMSRKRCRFKRQVPLPHATIKDDMKAFNEIKLWCYQRLFLIVVPMLPLLLLYCFRLFEPLLNFKARCGFAFGTFIILSLISRVLYVMMRKIALGK